jgi:hypothetical protein
VKGRRHQWNEGVNLALELPAMEAGISPRFDTLSIHVASHAEMVDGE